MGVFDSSVDRYLDFMKRATVMQIKQQVFGLDSSADLESSSSLHLAGDLFLLDVRNECETGTGFAFLDF